MPNNLAAAVACVDDVQQRCMRAINDEHKTTRQGALYQGQTRTYQPFQEGDQYRQPTVETKVQVRADEQFARVLDQCRLMWDAAAVRDASNMIAKASVVVDGNTLFADAPVPFLLYLEKQLVELRVFVQNMPVRDAAEAWTFDENEGVYRAKPADSHRTEKREHVVTLIEPTQHQPGQAELHWLEKPVGTYTTTRFSGAWSLTEKRAVIDRITRLADAVKQARTRANQIEAVEWTPALAITQYLWPARV